jgi:tRNA G18 (ribose-2'-O)-methylase SpoU
VDLFKIDVEGCEGDVLLGIEPKDWPKIRQVVVEVYNSVKNLPEVAEKLERQGFQVTAVPEDYAGEVSGTTMTLCNAPVIFVGRDKRGF